MYQMEKSQQVCQYTTSAVGTGYWVPAVAGQGFPVSVGGNRRAGDLLFGLLTYLTNLYFKIREDRRKAARGE